MLTVELEPELERRAREQASERGQSLSEYFAALIAGETNGRAVEETASALSASPTPENGASSGTSMQEEKPAPANMLEFLGDFVGGVDSDEEHLSEKTGEAFTDYVVQKHAAGHL